MEKLKKDLRILIESDYWQYLPESTKYDIRGLLGEDKWRKSLHRVEDCLPEDLVNQQGAF